MNFAHSGFRRRKSSGVKEFSLKPTVVCRRKMHIIFFNESIVGVKEFSLTPTVVCRRKMMIQ